MKHLANKTVLDVIGNTPIVKLQKIPQSLGIQSEIYVKLECLNPGGSIKDRIGKYILDRAVERGELKPGGTIIEGTSGNTGVGLAIYAALNGYKCIFTLSDKQSPEKVNNLRAFGAKVIVCPTNVEATDPRSYYSVSKRLAESIPNSYYVNQYDNLLNRETHYKTTGPEIFEQTKGEFDVFVAGVGTGGTISGTGQYLKEKMPHLKVVGVDIEGSILTEYHRSGKMIEAKPYVLEGIGEDIIPLNIDFKIIDEFIMIQDKESFIMTRKLLTEEGLFVGGSCGAAVVAALKYAKKLPVPKKILVILPDSGNRYTSKIFNDDWMRDKGYLDSSFNVLISDVLSGLTKSKENFIFIDGRKTIADAINMMKESDISQLPVLQDKKVIGIISENNLLRPLFEGRFKMTDNISLACQQNYRIVHKNELLSKVADGLSNKEIVLIEDNNEIISLLTNIDILNFIRGQSIG